MPERPGETPDVVVVGAGVFGAWTAFHLRRRGVRTLLVDAWEPGHLRAASSGESRVIRSGYGPRQLYTHWAWQALARWKEWQEEWGVELFHRLGALWLHQSENDYTRASLSALDEEKIPVETMRPDDLRARFPQMGLEGVGFAYFEPEAGALLAQRALRAVVEAYRKAGGEWRLGRAEPPGSAPNRGGRLEEIKLMDGSTLSAGSFVFAGGAWLPELFPALLRTFLRVTRQEVFFFGPPPGEVRFAAGALPVWLDWEFYGIPALAGRGLKVAANEHGPPFDPNAGDRLATAEGAAQARDYLARRFPALKYAPVVETRVCQYASTADGHLLLDRHPEWDNVWLAGGGSGHGFKLSPVVGERMAAVVAGAARAEDALPPAVRYGPRRESALHPAY